MKKIRKKLRGAEWVATSTHPRKGNRLSQVFRTNRDQPIFGGAMWMLEIGQKSITI